MAWTDERIKTLKRLHADGLSCSQIAGELGGLTRNAVIGKLTRLGLTSVKRMREPRHSPAPRVIKTRWPRRTQPIPLQRLVPVAQLPLPSEPPMPTSNDEIPIEQRRASVLELTADTCRWPVGEVGTEEFFFCGGPIEPGKPYCARHCMRAYDGFRRLMAPRINLGRKAA